jgi:type IV secretion system protein VirB11
MTNITLHREREAFLESMEPIAHLLTDDAITNIMMNPPASGQTKGRVFVKRGAETFGTELWIEVADAIKMLRRAAAVHRLELNDQHSELSCRADVYRLEGSIAPIVHGAAFTIRKHTLSNRTLENYLDTGELSREVYEFLLDALIDGKNILVGGATDSGKTTLLNALVQAISRKGRRILTIEDTPELQRPDELAIQLYTYDRRHTHETAREGMGFSTRDAVKAAMRHNPEHIIVGEVREGSAALEALKAWRTGHPGLATLHAGDTRQMIERIWDLCEEVSPTRPRMIASVIHVCVHIKRIGNRRHIQVDRVLGWDRNEESFRLETIGRTEP